MKKFFIGIFSIVLGFIGFSYGMKVENLVDSVASGTINIPANNYTILYNVPSSDDYGVYCLNTLSYYNGFDWGYIQYGMNSTLYLDNGSYIKVFNDQTPSIFCIYVNQPYIILGEDYGFNTTIDYDLFRLDILLDTIIPDKSITVFYNNGNSSTDITCDGVQAIQINGLSTITSTNTFTPYYNISYKDEDNQSLVESYSKDNLYLENGQFKKTYTGDNEWILTVQGNGNNNIFTGYLPTFEITGGIEEVSESGNIFNNFAENSLKFTLSNIPSYIQYVILLFILFFILGFIRKFRKK